MAPLTDPDVVRTLQTAREEALRAGQTESSVGYVLLAMVVDSGPAGQVLRRSGLSEQAVRSGLRRESRLDAAPLGLGEALDRAAARAESLGRRAVGWEDLLLAITDDGGEATRIIEAAGVRIAEVRDRTLLNLNIPLPWRGRPQPDDRAIAADQTGREPVTPPADRVDEPVLTPPEADVADDDRPRRVFVIYGRDLEARDAVRGFIRDLDLRPVEFNEVERLSESSAPLVPDTITAIFPYAQAVVALLTPDEIVTLHPELQRAEDAAHDREPAGQARPNVLFELGMALGVKPNQTIIVQIGGGVRPFSDIVGRSVLRLDDGSPIVLNDFKERLRKAGCPVRDSGSDWLNPERFTRLAARRRRPAP